MLCELILLYLPAQSVFYDYWWISYQFIIKSTYPQKMWISLWMKCLNTVLIRIAEAFELK